MSAPADAPHSAAYSLSSSEKQLARSLVDGGVLRTADIRKALEHAAASNQSLTASLLELNLVTAEALEGCRRSALGEPPLGGNGKRPDAAAAPPGVVEEPAPEPPAVGFQTLGTGPAEDADSVPTGELHLPGRDSQKGAVRKRLGELLIDAGLIDQDQLSEAIAYAAEKSVLLGTALVEKGFVTQEQITDRMFAHSAEVKKQASKGKRLRLGDILVEQKTITAEQLTSALEYSRSHRVRLGEALAEMKITSEREIAMALSKQMALPYVNLAKHPPDPTILSKVPKRLCLKNELIPFRLEGKMLTVAIVDPLNILAMDDIQKVTGCNVLPVIITKSDFDSAVRTFLGEEGDLLEMLDTSSADLSTSQDSGFTDDAGPIVALINRIVALAVQKGASDIHVDPAEKELRIRLRIDGVLADVMTPPKEAAAAISSRFKVLCNLDIAENRLPQDGKFRMRVDNRPFDFRVAVLPVVWGEKIVVRLLDQSRAQVSVDDLGLQARALDIFKWGIRQPNGIVLVTGPTGSGKSTTLYSALHALQDPKVNIHTAEDPVEFSVHGITQVAVKPEIGLTFAAALRSFLRQDPDVILVGEIRDLETATIAFKAAMTGHLVLSTLHTNDAVGTIDRLLTMGLDRFIVASAMKVILAQRLLRKLCLECRKPVEVPMSELVSLGVTAEIAKIAGIDPKARAVPLFAAAGCKECNEGFRGRMAVHEVLEFNEAFREKLILGGSNFELFQAARGSGMLTLRESALLRALEGITALDEVERVTAAADTAHQEQDTTALDEVMAESETAAPPAAVLVGRLVDRLEGLARMTAPADLVRPLAKAAAAAAEVVQSLEGDGRRARDRATLLEHYLSGMGAFADGQPGMPVALDVNVLLRDAVMPRIAELAARAGAVSGKPVSMDAVSLSGAYSEQPARCVADREKLTCCIDQLLVNSLAALTAGGKLGLTTRVFEEGGAGWIELSILDSGVGISQELGDVTRPGVTSHPDALGLGLSIVQRFADQARGRLDIKSKAGRGCLVKLRLPRAE